MNVAARGRKHPWLILGLLTALPVLAGGALLVWLNTPRHNINRESYETVLSENW